MKNYHLVTVQHQIAISDSTKTVKDNYLVDAHSPTDIEARITEELAPELREISIDSTKRAKVADVFARIVPEGIDPVDDVDNTIWHEAKMEITTLDETKPGQTKEKKQVLTVLVEADDLSSALQRLLKEYANSISNTRIKEIKESAIRGVF